MAKNLITPKLSVVMSVHNGEAHITEAIDSLLVQTFKAFELIIVNDGSTDKTAKILAAYNDPRLRIITQTNRGLVVSLNRAISVAETPLIARHDADDKSEPDRLEQQMKYLKKQPDVVIVGSSIKVMNAQGRVLHEHRVLLNDPELKQELLVHSPFAHGSVMFRKTAFDKAGGYQQTEWPAEDYGLWLRLSEQGKFGNLDEPLYIYREHSGGISSQNQVLQNQIRDYLRTKAWRQPDKFLKDKILTGDYPARPMGQFRVERITQNLLFSWHQSLRLGRPVTAARIKRLLISDRGLRRKAGRLAAIKLRLKRG